MKTRRYKTGTSRTDFKIVQREETKTGGTRPQTIKKGRKKKKKGGSLQAPRLLSLSHAQGLRPEMEDEACAKRLGEWTGFAIFDGHGGESVSKWLAVRLVPELLQRLHELNVNPADPEVRNKIARTLTRAYLDVDRQLLDEKAHFGAGSTAIVLAVRGYHAFVLNLGDSRMIWWSTKPNFTIVSSVRSTTDQTPEQPEERARAEAAGATVHVDPETKKARVHCDSMEAKQGFGLALSRAFGDFDLKPRLRLENPGQYLPVPSRIIQSYDPINGPVSCVPRISHFEAKPGVLTFALLACDGLWDVMSNEEAARRANAYLSEGSKRAADRLVADALALGSTDNVSVMLVLVGDRT